MKTLEKPLVENKLQSSVSVSNLLTAAYNSGASDEKF